jgi:hypothetical protein
MQYLDDELCNQICGLLINIHMEDRGKELEKKKLKKSGMFKTSNKILVIFQEWVALKIFKIKVWQDLKIF